MITWTRDEAIKQMSIIFTSPSKGVLEILESVEVNKQLFLKYKNHIWFFECSFELLKEISQNLVLENANDYRKVQLSLIKNSLEQIYASFYLIARGFINSSFPLLRSVYEVLGRVFFISFHGKSISPESVLSNEFIKQWEASFNMTNFFEHQLKLSHRKTIYKYLSFYSHWNTLAVMKDFSGANSKVDTNHNDTEMYFTILFMWFYSNVKFLSKIVFSKNREILQDDSLYQKLEIVENTLWHILNDVPVWKTNFYQDLENVFIILVSKDEL